MINITLGTLSLIAAGVNIYAASLTNKYLKHLFMISAVLALVYSYSYWYSTFKYSFDLRANVIYPMGIVTWLIVWIGIPLRIVYYIHTRSKDILLKAERLIEDASMD